MTNKIAKQIRWIIVALVTLSFVLNIIWQWYDGRIWAYWASRTLICVGFLTLGLSFILLPEKMMWVLIAKEEIYDSIDEWRIRLIALIVGGVLVYIGVKLSLVLYSAWAAEYSCLLEYT